MNKIKPGDNLILGDRAFRSISGDKFFNCDVCWTCHYFNFGTNKCSWTMIGNKLLYINKPGWFRCIFWKVGE